MKISAWWTMLFFAIAVILLYDKACNVPVVSHVENSPIVLHDTVVVTEWDTFYTPEKIVYKYLTKKDSVPLVEFSETADDETNLTILKDYFSIRETKNCYDFKEGQVNVHSFVHQNELVNQSAEFTPVFVNHEQPKKVNKGIYAGGGFSYMENKVNLNAEFTYLTGNNKMITVGKSITDKSGWCASYKTPLF